MWEKYYLLAAIIISTGTMYGEDQPRPCRTKEECEDLNNPCQCYCSGICGPRNKKPDDKPVWIENDPHGHYCYCKQWDVDNYEKRCKRKQRRARRRTSERTTNEYFEE